MDSALTRGEHEEYKENMTAEHKRIHKRIDLLESKVEKLDTLLVSVDRLTQSVKTICEELKEQSDRLARIEARDGEMWRTATTHVVTVLLGLALGYFFKRGGF